jgi:hypothetical protein
VVVTAQNTLGLTGPIAIGVGRTPSGGVFGRGVYCTDSQVAGNIDFLLWELDNDWNNELVEHCTLLPSNIS